eukprot:2077976-Prymnesium_polylepis.1
MPLLGERIYVSNPFSRQFLVGWIATLDSVSRGRQPTRSPRRGGAHAAVRSDAALHGLPAPSSLCCRLARLPAVFDGQWRHPFSSTLGQ